MKAIWNNKVIAESDDIEKVEGNYYFPRNSIKTEYFQESQRKTRCPWKGEASYYDLSVDGQINEAAAWYYPEPKPAANMIKDRVAFWHGVKVE